MLRSTIVTAADRARAQFGSNNPGMVKGDPLANTTTTPTVIYGGSADVFAFTVDTTKAGSASGTFIIPSANSDYTYSWAEVGGDLATGGPTDATQADQPVVTGVDGLVNFYIDQGTGTFNNFAFANAGDKLKIVSQEQWGTAVWAASGLANAFFGCTNLTVTSVVDSPDLSATTNLTSMFRGASVFNGNISSWVVSPVKFMSNMFRDATAFNGDISSWNVAAATNMTTIFFGVTLSTTNYDLLLAGWGAQTVQSGVAFHAGNSVYSGGGAAEAGRDSLLAQGWTIIDGSGVGADNQLFKFTVDSSLAGSADGNFIIPSANDDFDYTWAEVGNELANNGSGTVTQADDTIAFGSTGIYQVSIDPISGTGFNDFAFANAGDKLKIVSNEQWGSAVWAASGLATAFYGCSNLTVTSVVDSPDLSATTNLTSMFRGASAFNGNISSWVVSGVTIMSNMFRDATAFNTDISSWNVAAATNLTNMFFGATLSTTNYDALLIGWEAQTLQTGVVFHGGNSVRTSAADAAHASLVNAGTNNWTITDGDT
jgi:surface protein